MQQAVYTTDGPNQFLWTALDELTAVYHRPSGETHVVADPVPQILGALLHTPLTAADLLAALAQEHDLPQDEDTRAALQDRLDELVHSGLVFTA